MVKENLIIPKENKAQVEEVREIENAEQQQKKLDEKQTNQPTITENVKEAVVPTVHALDDDTKKIAVGANAASTGVLTFVCPPAGATVGGLQAATGAILKQSDDPEKKEDGEVLSDAAAIGGGVGGTVAAGETAATQGVKGVGEVANQVAEAIKNL
jgi:hypothetical protein